VWWTAVGPLVMTLLLVRVSGAGLLEKDIGPRRPGNAEYIERTSGFVPLPPRKGPKGARS
jgi:steroid 5-alpha reductase family enzyme